MYIYVAVFSVAELSVAGCVSFFLSVTELLVTKLSVAEPSAAALYVDEQSVAGLDSYWLLFCLS